MNDLKLSLEAIRVNMNVDRKEMAALLNVKLDRYNRLASGESKMYAVELIRLHEISGVAYELIDVQ